MSITAEATHRTEFSVANHVGHVLGLLLSVGNIWIGTSPEAREGDGYNGNIWVAFVGFSVVAVVALLASWITRASTPRRIAGTALVLVAVASLGVLFVPDIGTPGRIGNSVGALIHIGTAVLILLPSRKGARDVA